MKESPLLSTRGKGCAGSSATGVSTGSTSALKCRRTQRSWAGVQCARSSEPDALGLERRQQLLGRACGTPRPRARGPRALMRSRRSAPAGRRVPRCRIPKRTCCFRPATRTSKNSSRLLLKIVRKRRRSSSGSERVLGLRQHAPVELEQAQQPGEVEAGILQGRGRGGAGRVQRLHGVRRAPLQGPAWRPGRAARVPHRAAGRAVRSRGLHPHFTRAGRRRGAPDVRYLGPRPRSPPCCSPSCATPPPSPARGPGVRPRRRPRPHPRGPAQVPRRT